jgi:hypothetical protein
LEEVKITSPPASNAITPRSLNNGAAAGGDVKNYFAIPSSSRPWTYFFLFGLIRLVQWVPRFLGGRSM